MHSAAPLQVFSDLPTYYDRSSEGSFTSSIVPDPSVLRANHLNGAYMWE